MVPTCLYLQSPGKRGKQTAIVEMSDAVVIKSGLRRTACPILGHQGWFPLEVLLKLRLKGGGLSGAAQRGKEKGVSACLFKEDPPPALSSSICPHLLPAGGEMRPL